MNEIWQHYIEIITDPAHTLVESTFILLEFMIFQILLVQAKKACQKWIKREHRIIDEEHNHNHKMTRDEILDSILRPDKSTKYGFWYKGRHIYKPKHRLALSQY